MYRSRTVWRLNYRMVLSAERELEPANWNPHPGPFPSPTNATSTSIRYGAILIYRRINRRAEHQSSHASPSLVLPSASSYIAPSVLQQSGCSYCRKTTTHSSAWLEHAHHPLPNECISIRCSSTSCSQSSAINGLIACEAHDAPGSTPRSSMGSHPAPE